MKLRQNGVWVDVDTYIRQNGQWNYINFLRDANELLLIISQTTTNLNLQTAFNNTFGTTTWTSTRRKRVIINTGVIVGATNTANYALDIPSGLGGTLRIDNNGSIQGAGGAANGGTGGNAIFAGSPVSFNNQGTIYAGGGGGGAGGTGGQGFFTYGCGYTQFLGTGAEIFGYNQCDPSCTTAFGEGAYCLSSYDGDNAGYCDVYGVGDNQDNYTRCSGCARYVNQTCTDYTSGGAGGAGGRGQGYNQSATNGLGGSAGGTNAGTGGTGGNGGGWGSSGTNGNVGSNGNYTAAPTLGQAGGPGSAGLAGFYIVNNGNVTWIANGTRLGRVG